jgi:hypothetical protein
MLRFHAARASGDVVRSLVCLWGVLRAAFPARWWYRLWPSLDPARAILSLPDDLREKALASLFRIPGSGASAVADEDPVEVMRRIQREQAYGKAGASGRALTRYNTTDGFVPYRQAWVDYAGLECEAARQRLEMFAATSVMHQKNPQSTLSAWQKTAHPSDTMVS